MFLARHEQHTEISQIGSDAGLAFDCAAWHSNLPAKKLAGELRLENATYDRALRFEALFQGHGVRVSGIFGRDECVGRRAGSGS
jgi:hypothetical protein